MKKISFLLILMLMMSGCDAVISTGRSDTSTGSYDMSFAAENTSYSINDATYIELGPNDVNITSEGTYILSGKAEGSIIVNVSDSEDVHLVLTGAEIDAGDFAGIYIVEADEVTITLQEGTVNRISDSAVHSQIDDNDVDALIFSKADLTIEGSGTLELTSAYSHGIVSKDDLVIVSGTYVIDVAGRGLSGKDCLKIADGDITVTSGKDALRSDNDTDEGRGYVYIADGTFTIAFGSDAVYGYNAVTIEGGEFDIRTTYSSVSDSAKAIKSKGTVDISGGNFTIDSDDDAIHSDYEVTISGGSFDIVSDDDAIHADSKVQIDGGDMVITAHEGIEATYVLINGGDIDITASDDGINASQTVSTYKATVEITDGNIKISMGQGDTDAVDSNGYIIISGGTIDITAQSPFDYDVSAEYTGGTIIVNGQTVNQISNQMMGGFGGMGGMPTDGTMPSGTEPSYPSQGGKGAMGTGRRH